MPAPKGNKFWRARNTHGRPPIFPTPDELWEACVRYFEWVEANPLHVSQAVAYQGKVTVCALPRMRAMTLTSLRLHLHIGRKTWNDYSGRDGFSSVTARVEEIIYAQKFEGAAAGLLNPGLIARELGLLNNREINQNAVLSADNSVSALMSAVAR